VRIVNKGRRIVAPSEDEGSQTPIGRSLGAIPLTRVTFLVDTSCMRRRIPVRGWLLVLLTLVGVGAGAYSLGLLSWGVNRDKYVANNVAVLRELPVFPGARKMSEMSIGEKRNNGYPEGIGPYTSYITSWMYELPPGVSDQDILRFYDRKLEKPGWELVAFPPCERTYNHGDGWVYIAACHGYLRLASDHAARG
jgi:hypothetical protein